MSLLGEALSALRGRRRHDTAATAPAAPLDADQALVRAIIDGSQAAFAQLVETHQRTCAHVIGRMVGDRDQVADLLQETFLAVFRQLHRFRFESSLRTWVSGSPTPRRCSTCAGGGWRRNGWWRWRCRRNWGSAMKAPGPS
jgi:RNA polymerase sigma-70 factor (ECF subfamily)